MGVNRIVTPTPKVDTWLSLHFASLAGNKPSLAIALNIFGCPTMEVKMVSVIVVKAQIVTM